MLNIFIFVVFIITMCYLDNYYYMRLSLYSFNVLLSYYLIATLLMLKEMSFHLQSTFNCCLVCNEIYSVDML